MLIGALIGAGIAALIGAIIDRLLASDLGLSLRLIVLVASIPVRLF